jgi:hypothetical protein
MISRRGGEIQPCVWQLDHVRRRRRVPPRFSKSRISGAAAERPHRANGATVRAPAETNQIATCLVHTQRAAYVARCHR